MKDVLMLPALIDYAKQWSKTFSKAHITTYVKNTFLLTKI